MTKGIRMEPMAVLPFEKLVTLLEVVYGLRPQWDLNIEDVQVIEHEHTKMIRYETSKEVDFNNFSIKDFI